MSTNITRSDDPRPGNSRPVRRTDEKPAGKLEPEGLEKPVSETFAPPEGNELNIAELQRMAMKDLLLIAEQAELTEYHGLKKQDLILRILKERTRLNGLMFGEGTLEILPDGFGFLRSPDYHYLPCPDDIYVSPSQIRRFGLRTGATVAGQIRPPKENERYFALLRVAAVNGEDPNLLTNKVFFDDLTSQSKELSGLAGATNFTSGKVIWK